MKIAIIHDYLNEAGGAERVLRVLADMYPTAPIYTAFIKNGTARAMFMDRELHESSWGWILKSGRLYSYLRFLLPWIWGSIDLSSYDLVITSTSGGYIARGFKVGEKTRVVAYCHTPPKWLYGYETPTGAANKWWGRLFNYVFGPPLRYFDYISAQRVNTWIANSQEVALRIKKFYRREARVVYPPIEIKSGVAMEKDKKGDYFLLVTRVTGAKGIVEALNAARMGRFKLKLVGELIEKRLENSINQAGKNVEYLGRVSDGELSKLYANARGFIALARDEDFGMTVVEAMGYGTPILALKSGGYKETVVEGITGHFVEDVAVESILLGIKKMSETKWERSRIINRAREFDRSKFEEKIREII